MLEAFLNLLKSNDFFLNHTNITYVYVYVVKKTFSQSYNLTARCYIIKYFREHSHNIPSLYGWAGETFNLLGMRTIRHNNQSLISIVQGEKFKAGLVHMLGEMI